jgi:hypothetical protein
MSSPVSNKSEVELKCLLLVEKRPPQSSKPEGFRGQKIPPSGLPGLPFYRPREGQAYMREREKKKKEKNRENWS